MKGKLGKDGKPFKPKLEKAWYMNAEEKPYEKIETIQQYYRYCSLLETKVDGHEDDGEGSDIDVLTKLIEAYDEEHDTFD